jgi:hypothetical protein
MFEATLPRRRSVALLRQGFRRSSDRTLWQAEIHVDETPEARKARNQAMVDTLFDPPHPEEYRFRSD